MLKEGSVIEGKLIEAIEKDRWIVSFQGQLIQVQNTTKIEFQANKILRLKVIKQKPLQLSVVGAEKSSLRSLNIRV